MIRYREIIITYFTVIIVGSLLVYACSQKGYTALLYSLIFSFTMVKLAYVLFSNFRKLLLISSPDISYFSFLIFITVNIFLVILSFGFDYLCLYKLDKTSFTGLEEAKLLWQEFFKSFYLSFLLFTNIGVANVVPVSIAAETMVMLETTISFITVIVILSDFVNLRNSFENFSKKRLKKYKNRSNKNSFRISHFHQKQTLRRRRLSRRSSVFF